MEKYIKVADDYVSLQIAEDGVWAHFRVGNGYAYSVNLSEDDISRPFAIEYEEAQVNIIK